MIQLYKNCLTSTVVLPKISQGTSDARITIKCILNYIYLNIYILLSFENSFSEHDNLRNIVNKLSFATEYGRISVKAVGMRVNESASKCVCK